MKYMKRPENITSLITSVSYITYPEHIRLGATCYWNEGMGWNKDNVNEKVAVVNIDYFERKNFLKVPRVAR